MGFFARHGWMFEVALALVLLGLGVELPFADSGWVALVSLPMILLGAAWVVRALITPGADGAPVSLRRKQVALSFGVTIGMLLAAVFVASRVRYRPQGPSTTMAPNPHTEIGWAPSGPKGTVGSRLDVVDPGRDQILLIGDSIVFGNGVEAHQTVSVELQKLRPAQQILNGAVSGYSIDQYFLYLRRVLVDVSPKLIVVGLFSGNDFQLTARELTWGKGKPLYAVEGNALVRVGRADHCIDDLSGSLLFRALWQDKRTAKHVLVSMCRPRELRRGETEKLIARLYDEIDALAAARGIPVLWVMLPLKFDHSVHEETRYLHVARYPDLLRILGEKPRAIFDFSLDISPRHDELDDLYLSDNAHFTHAGHRLLAASLDREISARFPALGPPHR